MNIEIREALKERVLGFIQTEPGYDSNDVEEVNISHEMGSWSILYGESIQTGIVGLGVSPESSFEDFIRKWRSFKGFEWIKKARMLQGLR